MATYGWRGIPLVNPGRAVRPNGYGLGAWRAVAPQARTAPSRGRSGASGDRRGQPNELERALAREAIENDSGGGLNLFNAGGRGLMGVLDALDTPRAVVASAVREGQDLFDVGVGANTGGQASLDEFIAQARNNITGQEALGLNDTALPAPVATALGFGADVVMDPLTYVSGGAGKVGEEAGEQAARRFLTPAVKQALGEAAVDAAERSGRTFADDAARKLAITELGEEAGNKAAQKSMIYRSNQMLSDVEREAIGATPGTYLKIPGGKTDTGRALLERTGRYVEGRGGEGLIRVSNREIGAGRVGSRVRKALTQNRVADAVAERFVKYPQIRRKVLYGTPQEAFEGITTLTSRNAGDLQELLVTRELSDQWAHLQSRAKAAGVDGADLRYALGEADESFGPATQRVLAATGAKDPDLLRDVRSFMQDYIPERLDAVDPENSWLMRRNNYTTRTPSDEMLAVRGGWGNSGHMGPVDKRMYGPGEGQINELFDTPLVSEIDDPAGRSVEQQIDDILAENGVPGWFEQDIFKSMPDYIRRMSRRYGDEVVAKRLRDAGIAESSLVSVLTDAGSAQGRAKAAIFKLLTRARIREGQAARAALNASAEAEGAVDGVITARGLVQRARDGAAEAAAENKVLTDMVGALDPVSIRNYGEELAGDAARLDVSRQALLDNVMQADDEVFTLGHLEVEHGHRLAMEQYKANAKVTRLENHVNKLYDEMATLHERLHIMSGFTDYKASRSHLDDLITRLEERADRIIENPARYGADAFDDVAAKLDRLNALKTDNVAFKEWADKQNNLGRYKNELNVAAETSKLMKEAEDELAEVMRQINQGEAVLHEFEDVATLPTDQLDNQIAQADQQIEAIYTTPGRKDGKITAKQRRQVEALAEAKASALHQKGVIERARARVAQVDETGEALLDRRNALMDQESVGDRIIHAVFPELPGDVQGSRIRTFFSDRHKELLAEVDATNGALLSAYDDADSMRVELSSIRQDREAAERKLSLVNDKTSRKDAELAELQNDYTARSEAALDRAAEIDDEIYDAQQQIELNRVPTPGDSDLSYAELMSERHLALMEGRQLRLESAAIEAESKAANARKTAEVWNGIGERAFSKKQETALALALKDSYHKLGAVSQTRSEWIVEALKASTVMNGPEGIRPVLRAYDKVLNLWKAYALATPGTVNRNLFGAVFNNYLADIGVSMNDYKIVMRYGQGFGRDVGGGVAKLSARDQGIMEAIRGAGLMEGGVTSLEVERSIGAATSRAQRINPLNPDNLPLHKVRHAQGGVENLARGALAYRTMANGGTIDDAIANVIKFHFNYEDLNKFERSALRRVVPFYTWTRKNFPLMLQQIVQKPTKFTRFYQLRNEIELHSPEEMVVPAYFGENMAVRLPFTIGGSRSYYLPDLPFTALSDVTDPTVALSSMSPFIKTPIEYAFGRQFFKGIPLRDEYQEVPGALRIIPGAMQGLDALGVARRGENGQWYMKQKDLYGLESFLPAFGRARRLFPTEDKYDERVLGSWLSFVAGAGFRVNAPQEQRNEIFRRVDSKLDQLQTAEELGYITEDMKQPRFGQTINAGYQMFGVQE